eukprot:scaffold41241_cov57-Phaeocystis_antarctica.AAC.2
MPNVVPSYFTRSPVRSRTRNGQRSRAGADADVCGERAGEGLAHGPGEPRRSHAEQRCAHR